MGYPDDLVISLTKKYMAMGYTSFKIKVGVSDEDDYRRCKLVRETIGEKNNLVKCYEIK